MAILNPTLYNSLCRRFGEDSVKVVAGGMGMNWKLVANIFGESSKRRPRREVLASGEEYAIRCPFCKDHRQRLFINHRWGAWDPETGTRNYWLAQCFNEQCLADFDKQEQMYKWLYAEGGVAKEPEIGEGEKSAPSVLREMSPPGPTIRLDRLAVSDPHHYALAYLESRYFDPAKLGRQYGVSYCPESRHFHAQDRIIAPVYYQKTLVGWQARYIGDDVQGRPFNEMGVPKYYTCPNMARNLVAYNMERAMRHPTAVTVEGVTDVWNFGPMALAALGGKLSKHLVAKITETMLRRWGEQAAMVVLLDPTWDDRARKKRIHPINALEMQFVRLRLPVLPVFLPDSKDPGESDRDAMRALIRKEGRRRNIPITFARVPCKLEDES
jgi:hypothetical protein